MTGLHYPDNLYADHEERKARRIVQNAPLGAYKAPQELSASERKLRTALSYVCHARDLIREALGEDKPSNPENLYTSGESAKESPETERVPKWDPAWINTPPNCDGLKARDVRAPHPMQAEVIRDHDERLAGGEDRL